MHLAPPLFLFLLILLFCPASPPPPFRQPLSAAGFSDLQEHLIKSGSSINQKHGPGNGLPFGKGPAPVLGKLCVLLAGRTCVCAPGGLSRVLPAGKVHLPFSDYEINA